MAEKKSWTTGRFDGKIAVVTGAARGTGRAAAVALAQAGADVVLRRLLSFSRLTKPAWLVERRLLPPPATAPT